MSITRLSVNNSVEVTPLRGQMVGVVIERENGDMLIATSSPFKIHKSTDGGATWTEKFADAHPNRNGRLTFETSSGTLLVGDALTSSTSKIYRSTDDGETWNTVLTVDSDSSWYMIQRNNGDLYLNEYNSSNTTKFAYNIWKSVDDGANWTKFYTHPAGADPTNQNNRTMRHFHLLCRNTDDQMYVSIAHGYDTGTYELNDDGTLGDNIGDYYTGSATSKGGGLTAYVQADNGDMFFGPDNTPTRIFKYQPDAEELEDKLLDVHNILNTYGSDRQSFILGMSKGRHGVLYAIMNGETTKKPFLLISGDDGANWKYMNFTTEIVRPTFVSVSRSSRHRIHIDQGINRPYITLPDFTKQQVMSM